MYQISADDIGCMVIVEATLADGHDRYGGVAIGEIGKLFVFVVFQM